MSKLLVIKEKDQSYVILRGKKRDVILKKGHHLHCRNFYLKLSRKYTWKQLEQMVAQHLLKK